MQTPDLSSYTPEQIAQLVPNWPPSEMAQKILQLTDPQLEAVGKSLTLPQALQLLDYAAEADPQFHWKLSPLLVGMSHSLFSHILLSATPQQMNILKLEAVTEPIHHQLTLLTHKVTHQLPLALEQVDQISSEIALLSVAEAKDPNLLRNKLKTQSIWYESTLALISKTLSLAWNSNRPDLIDKLSHAKEWCQRTLMRIIGHPKTAFGEATGFFAKLDENLDTVYGNPRDPAAIEASDDDEPALEGLAKFSIWYLKDYQELGLLSDTVLLDLDPATHSEKERLEYREKLIDQVRQNLAASGLSTIKDLKQADIYSADALKAYLFKLEKK